MLYLVISATALIGAFSMYINNKSIMQMDITKLFLQQFVTDVNLHTSLYKSSFNVYIPYGACNAKFYKNKLLFDNSSFIFNSNISMNWSLLCNKSQSINISLTRFGNNFVIGVEK